MRAGAVACLAAWVAGWVIGFPFEILTAWRYVDGQVPRLPAALAEGLVVWAAFSGFMAVAGFLPVVLPLVLVVSPAWIVRWRWWLIPLVGVAAFVAIAQRMHLMSPYYFHRLGIVRAFFFSAPNFFVITFAMVVLWVYSARAKRRLEG